jgi:hypothetical protein
MDTFVKNITALNEKDNDIYITYFLYRIWIKYRNLVITQLGRDEYNSILELLKIPKEYHTVNIVFPLSNFMFYDEKKKVDMPLLTALTNIDVKMKGFGDSIKADKGNIKEQYDNFLKYITELEDIKKLEDIIIQFRKKLNLQYRNVYIKELNTPMK